MVRSCSELIYQIIELYRGIYKVTDPIDERLVLTWIQQTRAKLLKQRIDEPGRFIDEHCVQTLGGVEMELVDSSTYPTIPSNRKILRTVRDLPATIDTKGDIGTYTLITAADKMINNFTYVSYDRAMFSCNGKFNNRDIYAYLDGKRMCLISSSGVHKGIKYITIKGVFANPIEAYEFVNGVGSYDWDMEYPISETIVEDIKNMIVQSNFKLILNPMQDVSNNSNNDVVTTPEVNQG